MSHLQQYLKSYKENSGLFSHPTIPNFHIVHDHLSYLVMRVDRGREYLMSDHSDEGSESWADNRADAKRYGNQEEALEAMVSTDISIEHEVTCDKAALFNPQSYQDALFSLPSTLKMYWSNPHSPVFTGLNERLSDDERNYPMVNWLAKNGWVLRNTLIIDLDDFDCLDKYSDAWEKASDEGIYTTKVLNELPSGGVPLYIADSEEGVWLGYIVPIKTKIITTDSHKDVAFALSQDPELESKWGMSDSSFNNTDDNELHLGSFEEVAALVIKDLEEGEQCLLAEYVVTRDQSKISYNPEESSTEIFPADLFIISSVDRLFTVTEGKLVEGDL